MPGGFRDTNGDFLKGADEANPPADKINLIAAIEGEKAADGKSGKAMVVGSSEVADDKWLRVDGNIVFLAVDQLNGAVLSSEAPGSINEAFISGTQPGANRFNRQP